MKQSMSKSVASLMWTVAIAACVTSCGVDGPDGRDSVEPTVQPFFDSPGTRDDNDRNRLPSEFLVQQIDEAKQSINACIYGFSKGNVIDALIRAYDRGVDVRVAGDAQHLQYGAPGYKAIVDRQIPLQVGNQFHIMHNKFFVIDGRFVFVGTGNITTTGFGRNNNNWVYIDSIPVAKDFVAEFNQMFSGRFSTAKKRIDNGERYEVGDTEVEVHFSPQEDTMGVMLEELEKVDTSIFFQIFAFTKDQVGSHFIQKHRQFIRANEQAAADGKLAANWRDQSPLKWPKKVVGILDRSQLHGNGQYHEGYRLEASGVPMRLEANENSRLPGDYQSGGGRLHTKTMILDYGTPDARVLTGSFNWSSSATIANDEVLLVLRGQRVAEHYMDEFRDLWHLSRTISDGVCYYLLPDEYPGGGIDHRPVCSDDVEPGDVVFSEIQWDGWNDQPDPSDHKGPLEDRDDITNDEFIELHNTTDRPINLSMWTITNGYDFKVGFSPGTVILPGEYFLILDHNVPPYSEGDPQRGHQAFLNPDFVLNKANDPRFPRLNLKNTSLRLDLRDATAEVIDRAGDGGPAFWGGRKSVSSDEVVNRSMERKIGPDETVEDGAEAGSWKPSGVSEGGANVNSGYKDIIMATPGEANSGS